MTTGSGAKRFDCGPLEENGCGVGVGAQLHLRVHEELLACSKAEGAAEEDTLVQKRQLVSEEECWRRVGVARR